MKPPRSILNLFPDLKKCIDAKRPVEVDVKAADVKGADKKDFQNCAMARAICREWKADSAVIGLSYSYVIRGKTAMRFKTPTSVQREIVAFDRHHDFKPGAYHLAAVPKTQRRKPSGPKKPKASHAASHRVIHKESLGVRQMKDLAP